MPNRVLGKPGPFQIVRGSASGANERPNVPPRRRYLCKNYQSCLSIAAALNWDNFTCRGCSGEVDESTLWKAHQEIRRDKTVRRICALPSIVAYQSEAREEETRAGRPSAENLLKTEKVAS